MTPGHGAGRLGRVLRRVTRRRTSRGVILLYHRVADLPTDPQWLCVSPRRFAEHLEILRRHWSPLALDRLVQSVGDGTASGDAVAVTFDDGYHDNLDHAKPLLEQHGVPATVFVTTGYLGGTREYWWDELERLILIPPALPRRLVLWLGGHRLVHELGPAVERGSDTPSPAWTILDTTRRSRRQELYASLHRALLGLSDDQRRRVLDDLRTWAGLNGAARATHRALTPDEVIRLVDGGLIDVGAHTVTHPVLSRWPAAMQRAEIAESKQHLERIVGRPVASFAYPFGTRADYTRGTVGLVKHAGFARACTS